LSIDKGQYYSPDPSGLRVGNGVGPRLTETFEQVATDAEAILDKVIIQTVTLIISSFKSLSKINVTRKLSITLRILQEKLDNIRGAVTMGNLIIPELHC